MSVISTKLSWQPRSAPLVATAAVAQGDAAERLRRRLLAMDDELSSLRGVATDDALVVLASDPSALPWVDGVSYLGVDPTAPDFLWPTTVRPTCHPALVARALAQLATDSAPAPWAVLVDSCSSCQQRWRPGASNYKNSRLSSPFL
jgi:hypothetical protein